MNCIFCTVLEVHLEPKLLNCVWDGLDDIPSKNASNYLALLMGHVTFLKVTVAPIRVFAL